MHMRVRGTGEGHICPTDLSDTKSRLEMFTGLIYRYFVRIMLLIKCSTRGTEACGTYTSHW